MTGIFLATLFLCVCLVLLTCLHLSKIHPILWQAAEDLENACFHGQMGQETQFLDLKRGYRYSHRQFIDRKLLDLTVSVKSLGRAIRFILSDIVSYNSRLENSKMESGATFLVFLYYSSPHLPFIRWIFTCLLCGTSFIEHVFTKCFYTATLPSANKLLFLYSPLCWWHCCQ